MATTDLLFQYLANTCVRLVLLHGYYAQRPKIQASHTSFSTYNTDFHSIAYVIKSYSENALIKALVV
jgi:hypothetical protein